MRQKWFMLPVLLLILSCAHFQKTEGTPFAGTVVYVEIEGGFYGITTSDGQRIDPINLPDAYKIDGLVVTGRYISRPDVQSIRMWGKIVELLSIDKGSAPDD